MNKAKIRSFTDLDAWKEGHKLVLMVRDVGYLNKKEFQEIAEQSVKVHKIVNGLIKSSRSQDFEQP